VEMSPRRPLSYDSAVVRVVPWPARRMVIVMEDIALDMVPFGIVIFCIVPTSDGGGRVWPGLRGG
jgi:hypothetical protein